MSRKVKLKYDQRTRDKALKHYRANAEAINTLRRAKRAEDEAEKQRVAEEKLRAAEEKRRIKREWEAYDEVRCAELSALAHTRWLAWRDNGGVVGCENYPKGMCCEKCHKLRHLRLVSVEGGRYAYACCQKIAANSEALGYYDGSVFLIDDCCGGLNTLARTKVDYAHPEESYSRKEIAKLPKSLLRSYLEAKLHELQRQG